MTKNMIRIHNLETNEILDREMNLEELQQLEREKNALEKEAENNLQTELDKKALLERLGITAQEAKLLLS